MIQLRPYQEEARQAIHKEWSEVDKTLLVLPTGTGKTIVFAKLCEDLVRAGHRILVMAHRGELLSQAADKIMTATKLGCSVEKAEETALGEFYRITVGSVQTLMRPQRLEQFPDDYYSIIIVDEAHHILSPSYQAVLNYFKDAKVLGVTATPDRGDKKNLGQYFDTLAYEYTLPRAIHEGFLTKIKALTIPIDIDLSNITMQGGDFKLGDIDNKLMPFLGQIVEEMKKYCFARKTVVFLPLIATSQKMCELLNDAGFSAAEVNGESKDRAEILEDFDNGKYQVLCNSMLLTEGWDCPSVDCIICLRPTKIRSLYCQIIGRGTRLFPGKEHLLILDFLWHSERHELCRPGHLIAESAEVAQKMTEKMAASPELEFELEELNEQAKQDAIAEREEALAKQLEEQRHKKRKLVDPLRFELSVQAEDLVNYEPEFGWEIKPPTSKQKESLERQGIFPDEIQTAGKATAMLERLAKRRNLGLSSPKQIRCLERYGFKNVGTWTFEAANKAITRIAANKWRVPHGMLEELNNE